MSTEIADKFGDHDLQITQYWGGEDMGVCMQITGRTRKGTQYVDLTIADAAELISHLIGWLRKVDSGAFHD